MDWQVVKSLQVVLTVVFTLLVPVPGFTQAGPLKSRPEVPNEVRPCLALFGLSKQDVSVEQAGKCCGSCVKVLSYVATNATNFWKMQRDYRWAAVIIGTFLAVVFILMVAWWGIGKRWRVAFWVAPFLVAFGVALGVVGLERLLLASEEQGLMAADLVLRDLAAQRLAYTSSGQVTLTCAEAIQQQARRYPSECASPVEQYPGLTFPGFTQFDTNVSKQAQQEERQRRAAEAYQVLTLQNANIEPSLRPDSVADVYKTNLIFAKSSEEWLSPFASDWLPPLVVFLASLLLSALFGVVKKRVNIMRTSRYAL